MIITAIDPLPFQTIMLAARWQTHATLLPAILTTMLGFVSGGGYEVRKSTLDLVRLGVDSKCLDGSEGGYYIRPGLEEVNNWVVSIAPLHLSSFQD